MSLPPREALLDIDWLTRIHAAEGFDALLRYVRNGAEAYGGPVTAVGEAVSRLGWPPSRLPRRDFGDLRYGLAHALATGSWSRHPDPDVTSSASLWTVSPEERAEWPTEPATSSRISQQR